MRRLFLYLSLLATVAFAAQPDFTVALLPDIQCITQAGNTPSIFNWIVANRTTCSGAGCPTSGQWNIRAIWSLGDNTQQTTGCSGTTNGHEIQDVRDAWDIARTASPSFDSLVPVLGNHDYNGGGLGTEIASRLTTAWNALFTPTWYATLPGNYVADGYPSSSVTDNFYTLPTVGGYPMLVMGLEFYPRSAAVTWGNAILSAHEDRTQIILTHAALTPCGGAHNVADADQWGPNGYGVGGSASTNGQELFDSMIKIHNVALAANGHFIAAGAGTQCDGATFVYEADQLASRTTYPGNVIQIFSDYQQQSSQRLVTLMRFRPSFGIVEIYNYDIAGGAMRAPAMHTLAWTPPPITSAQSGDWNDTATWMTGIVPLAGDTVKIADGHTVTIPAGYHAVVGASGPAGGQYSAGGVLPAISCGTNTGTGILVINGTLTFRGNVEQCLATWQANAGAIIEHDSSLAAAPAITHYRWFVGASNRPVTAKLQIRGASGNRVNIRNATGSGTFYGFTPTLNFNTQDSGAVDFEYATINGCGGSTPCIDGSAYSNAFTMRCDHCLISNSGEIKFSEQAVSTASFSLTNTTITAPGNSSHTVATVGSVSGSNAAILLDTIYTDGIINFNGTTGTTANNYRVRNVIIRDIANTSATLSNAFRLTEFDRVLRITDTQGQGSTGSFAYIPGGNLTRLMCLMQASTNPHCFSGPRGVAGQDDSIDGAYMEESGANTDGDSILGGSGPATLTTIKNVVMACNAATGSSMSLSSTAIPSTKTFSLLNNTYCGKDDGNARGFGFEDANGQTPGATAAAGMLTAARNNIVFCATNVPCYLVHKGPTGVAQDGTYTNVDYNWTWNASAGPYYDNTGGKYSPAPGTHDSTGNPQFVQQRHFLEWGQSLKPTIATWSDIVAEFAKMNDDSGFDLRFTILNAYSWLREGYQPQNAETYIAGDDGGPVGALNLSAGISNVTITGVTNTQATITYTPPSVGACLLELSESSTYLPVVHDVNGVLFAGANSDDRATSLGAGTLTRTVVFGQRIVQASGGTNYSRALQANTQHYFRITCGATVATGTFLTANIPVNMTYQDIPQLDPANPGDTVTPTLTTSRTQTIVDPHTGALIKRVSVPNDVGDSGYDPGNSASWGPYMYSGGFVRVCGDQLIGPGPGFLCGFAKGNGGIGGALYYIIPSTGESRYLGRNSWGAAYPKINSLDSKFYNQNGGTITQYTYTGNYLQAANNSVASFSSSVVISNLESAIQAFDSAYDPAYFGCSVAASIGEYLNIQCNRGSQDSYGWVVIVRVSTGTVIAATMPMTNIQCRWCATHQTIPLYDQPVVSITTHGLVGTGIGLGQYTTTYAGGGTLSTVDTALTVAGEPGCTSCGADPVLPLARAGDVFRFADSGEKVLITTKNSPTSWTVQRAVRGTHASTHAPGATLVADCNYTPIYWRYADDPHGTDTSNSYFIADSHWAEGGHDDMTTDLRITENTGYDLKTGDLIAGLNTPITAHIPNSPLFAGALAECYGNNCAAHPSTVGPGVPWLTDYFIWDAAGEYGVLSPKSGQLYQYTNANYPLIPRYFAIASAIGAVWLAGGPHFLLDVSGPGITLATDATDNYKYCVANAAGECYAGSVKGNIYVNLPGTVVTTCHVESLCMGNFGGLAGAVIQVGTSPGMARVISGGLAPLRNTGGMYSTAKALADGSWELFTIGDVHNNPPSQILMAKVPPLVAVDAVDRSKFVSYSVALTAPAGLGVTHAAVKFGYMEQGTAGQYYCTSRREVCVANSASAPPTNGVTDPFKYLTTDTWTGLACATSCTVTLPLLPAHVAYYQPIYLDAGGAVVSTGPVSVAGDWMTVTVPTTGVTTYTGTSRMTGTAVLK